MMYTGTNPLIIGIAGGSCSGKNSISKILMHKINGSVTILHEKGYYKNVTQVPKLEKYENNFDHPNVLDNYLLIQQVKKLINNQNIHEPFYSYKTHHRLNKYQIKKPAQVIIIEGILALYDERLRKLMNIKVFVNASSDTMLIRRIVRDLNKAQSNLSTIFSYYLQTIRPMYKQFVLPTQRYADIIIPEKWENMIAINTLASRINVVLNHK